MKMASACCRRWRRSYALSGEEKKAREAGCDDYIPKPYSPGELLAKVRQYLSD